MSKYNGKIVKQDNPCVVYHAHLEDIGRFDHKMVGYIVKKDGSVRQRVSVFPDGNVQNGNFSGVMIKEGCNAKEHILCIMQSTTPPLPYDAEVEYLESTGTQYIDTGINTTETLSYDIECSFLSNDQNLIGATYDSGGNVYHRCNFGVNSGFKIYYGRTSPSAWTPQSYNSSFHRFRQLISKEDIIVYFDDVSYDSFTRQTYNLNLNFWLFGRNSNTQRLKIYCSCRIKSAKIQDEDNVVLADMIPVRVGSTGYMYDRVSGQLFGNDGTENFIVGPDV